MITRVVVAALLLLAAPRAVWAQRDDVIRGRVTGPDGQPVAGVTVRATSYSGGVTRAAQTDRGGRYTIIFQRGEGDYWLSFSAIGYVPRRFEVKRVGDEEVLLGDARLASSIATLDAVNISANATRALPARTDAGRDVSGTDRVLSGTDLPPDLGGNLAAAAALHPGIQLIPGLDGAPDVFTALGIGAEQNNATYNGLGSALTTLPRDALTTATVRTFNFDPAIGGFGGGQIAITTRPGTNYSSRLMSGLTRGPPTELTSDVAEEQGAKNTVLSLGGNAAGPIRFDRAFYSLSWQLDRDVRDLRTMLNTSDAGLAGAGVARDSVTRLLDVLGRLGVPANLPNTATTQGTDRVSVQGNIDLAPSLSGVGHSFTLGVAAALARTSHAGVGQGAILTTPAHNAGSRVGSGSVALRHSNYFGFGVLSTTTAGVALSRSVLGPYLTLPHGVVRVRSELDEGGGALRTLSFGGNPAERSGRESSLELLNQLSWYERNNRHAIKVSSSLRSERYSSDESGSLLGAFSFASLADLAAGRPERYERLLSPRLRRGGQLVGSLAIGDAWRPSTDLQLQLGLRVDGNRLTDRPATNPTLAAAFGARNDRVPDGVYLSPRFGFQWFPGRAPTLAALLGGARAPRAIIQGGVGVFQNVARAATLLDPVIASTGLRSASLTLECVGDAAPSPSWASYLTDPATIPDRCAGGSVGSALSTVTPTAAFYDPTYSQPRVLRANLAVSGPVWSNRFALGGSLQLQRASEQEWRADANLDPTVRFALESESGRPVYAPLEGIVESSGAVALASTRRDPAFGRVTSIGSGLRQELALASVSVRPAVPGTTWNWALTYTRQLAREETIGFASAGGDPFARGWSAAIAPRTHAVTGTLFYNAFDVVRFNLLVIAASGGRFTPTVLGDINGDGVAFNDRAFIADSTLTLLGDAPARVRRCLGAQIGTIAARASCDGPWQTTANLNVSFNPQKLRLPQRARMTLTLNNPLLLADLLAHGERGLRGWGQTIAPDPILLAVRGFDRTGRKFRYDVNQRFGSTRPSQAVQRAQTYVSLHLSYDLGPARERQVLTQRLDVGRRRAGDRQPAAALRTFALGSIPNPFFLILQQADSLRLTRTQADSLALLNRAYAAHADSLWGSVTAELAALPADYDPDVAYRRYVRARERTIDHLIARVPTVKALLTPEQRRRLAPAIVNWLDVRVLQAIRSSTSG